MITNSGEPSSQEVLGDTLQKSFGDAVREQKLQVAGYPKFDAAPPKDGAPQTQTAPKGTSSTAPAPTSGSIQTSDAGTK